MAQVTINIDRTTDVEVVIVTVNIDGNPIQERYFFDTMQTDVDINNYVLTDLQNKRMI